jgi:hypothetical protein
MSSTELQPDEAQPTRTLLTSRGDYLSAADFLLGRVGRELKIFDPALEELRLEHSSRIELLNAFLVRSPANRLFIALNDVEHVKRYCPRLMRLLTTFSASMFIHRTEGDAARVQDCFVLADNAAFVRRPVSAQPRGVFVTGDVNEASVMRKRFDEIWHSSIPGESATVSGL